MRMRLIKKMRTASTSTNMFLLDQYVSALPSGPVVVVLFADISSLSTLYSVPAGDRNLY